MAPGDAVLELVAWPAELSGRVEPDTGPDIDPETGRKLIPWNHAVPGHALEGVPVVVLVDAETASAAEILAGLLQERAGAVVLGAPTWGKGLAQALRAEPAGGSGQVGVDGYGRDVYRTKQDHGYRVIRRWVYSLQTEMEQAQQQQQQQAQPAAAQP